MQSPKPKHAYLLRPVANEDARRLRARGITVTPLNTPRDEYLVNCCSVVRRYIAYDYDIRDAVMEWCGDDWSSHAQSASLFRAALREALPVVLRAARAGRIENPAEDLVRIAVERFRADERQRRMSRARSRPRARAPASRAAPRGGEQ